MFDDVMCWIEDHPGISTIAFIGFMVCLFLILWQCNDRTPGIVVDKTTRIETTMINNGKSATYFDEEKFVIIIRDRAGYYHQHYVTKAYFENVKNGDYYNPK